MSQGSNSRRSSSEPVKRTTRGESSSAARWLSTFIKGNTPPPATSSSQNSAVTLDFPYLTVKSELRFFSTRSALCQDIFGFAHGNRIRLGKGRWQGANATVVGARGGQLWIALDGSPGCIPFTLPDSYLTPTTRLEDAFTTCYEITRVSEAEGPAAFASDPRHHAAIKASQQLSKEHAQFLQLSPDLFAQLVETETGGKHPEVSYKAFATTPSTLRTFLILAPSMLRETRVMGWAAEGDVSGGCQGDGEAIPASLSVAAIIS